MTHLGVYTKETLVTLVKTVEMFRRDETTVDSSFSSCGFL